MSKNVLVAGGLAVACSFLLAVAPVRGQAAAPQPGGVRGASLSVEAGSDGAYVLRSKEAGDVLRAEMWAQTQDGWLRSSEYPRHLRVVESFQDELGAGQMLTVTHTGMPGTPDLVSVFRVYENQPWGDLQLKVVNSTGKLLVLRALDVVRCGAGDGPHLNGPESSDRVLSDSFSEEIPLLRVKDLGEASDGLHRAFGSQLIYNRASGESLFLGALSADRLLTVFHLRSAQAPEARVVSFDVENAGTSEALQNIAKGYDPDNAVPLQLQLVAGQSVASERLMFAIGSDYHAQLENYGRAIRLLHAARAKAPTLLGWWSWTAYYFGINEGTTLTNAAWLEQSLASYGYRYFQVDEGYQYARGEYSTPDATSFPHGMAAIGREVRDRGLTFGLWVAPFQVSERSWVYTNHPEWLVHNLHGAPIHISKIGGSKEELYALDTTHPGAQQYLRETYTTLVRDWGARFLKLDFMDITAVEGVYYKPGTTALEALRIGLETIRQAVGDDVLMDKDGSPMLTPVGIVDAGRISQDTGHAFAATRDAASGIAARYYMNHNFYESDPDAFTVSSQVVADRTWHNADHPLTLEEAEASIALSAVSGGMFEIGDDLPALGASPGRLELVKNRGLLEMARLGRASTPIDLMTYRSEDGQPSVFLLKEDRRQSILTVFNWTEKASRHSFDLRELGLKAENAYAADDLLRGGSLPLQKGRLEINVPPGSVRMIRLIDTGQPVRAPEFKVEAPAAARTGATVFFEAQSEGDAPVLIYRWDFGDGVQAEGERATHAFTQAGTYRVTVTAEGIGQQTSSKTQTIAITGRISAAYDPAVRQRFVEAR